MVNTLVFFFFKIQYHNTSAKFTVDHWNHFDAQSLLESLFLVKYADQTLLITSLVFFPGELPYRCDFEFDTCGMTQSTADNFDWTRRSGPTDTLNTGPPGGYNSQYYLYIETSTPRNNGDRAM